MWVAYVVDGVYGVTLGVLIDEFFGGGKVMFCALAAEFGIVGEGILELWVELCVVLAMVCYQIPQHTLFSSSLSSSSVRLFTVRVY